jgi:hypothetical protein
MAEKIKMQAIKGFPYAGKRRNVGDTFNATKQDARALEAVGMAIRAPVEYAPKKAVAKKAIARSPVTKVETADQPATTAVGAATRGTYQTKDMPSE